MDVRFSKIWLSVSLFWTIAAAAGQNGNSVHLSLQYIGLTFHPGGGNLPEQYPLKLDRKGYLVLETGGIVGIDYYVRPYFFARFAGAFFLDCAQLPAGFVHIGIRGIMLRNQRHTISGGMGPTLIFRKDWHSLPGYNGDKFYDGRVFKGWQYRFILYGGEFEYSYKISDKIRYQFSIIPGYPFVITIKTGIGVKI